MSRHFTPKKETNSAAEVRWQIGSEIETVEGNEKKLS
jgi:hypothetical protein